jgi:NAD+ synthase
MTKTFTLALAQINTTVGAIDANVAAILGFVQRAADAGGDLVLFPEMALTGYPPEDLVLALGFRDAVAQGLENIAQKTSQMKLAIIMGTLWEEAGHIYNASVLIEGGAYRVIRRKHALPNYGVFDEKRVFEPGPMPEVLEWRGIKLGVLICEEVWSEELPKHLAAQGAELLLVQNASPYHIGKAGQRLDVVKRAADATQLPIVYLNLVGGQDELVFDGRSYLYHPQHHKSVRLPAFAESLALVGMQRDAQGWRSISGPLDDEPDGLTEMYHALVLGLRDYVHKNRFPGVVIGLSGGIDSGLSAAIAVDALGASRVLGVRLSSPYTSQDSLEDAEQLAKNLGIQCETVPISAGMEAMNAALKPVFDGREADTTEENIQARLRGVLLMAISNKLGHMVLTTGNKSEMSVGYATLYGDMCGGFSVLKDVYKTTVYKLSEFRNNCDFQQLLFWGFHGAASDVIPRRMLTKPPTAELRPGQTDQDNLPPYSELDILLRGLIERRKSVAELVTEGMPEATVKKIAKMVIGAEYKRRQSAPGVKITPMAFGRDRRWPITNHWKFE